MLMLKGLSFVDGDSYLDGKNAWEKNITAMRQNHVFPCNGILFKLNYKFTIPTTPINLN